MSSIYRMLLMFALLLIAVQVVHAQQQWGNLQGRFVVIGEAPPLAALPGGIPDESRIIDAKNNLANAFIYLRTKPTDIHINYNAPALVPLVIDIQNSQYNPHAAVLWKQRTLLLKNSDDVGHSLNYSSMRNGFNALLAGGAPPTKRQFTKPELKPESITCNIHATMSAKLLVSDNPYGVVSTADGTFEIKDLPAGALEFQLWHEKCGFLKSVKYKGGTADTKGRIKLNLQPGDNDMGDIDIPVEMLK